MNKNILALFLSASFLSCTAQEQTQDNQLELRLNPEIESGLSCPTEDYNLYPFLNLEGNGIAMNGADWSGLSSAYRSAAAGDTVLSVLYLGDSHIQADFGGSVLRERLARAAGDCGRGIIIPFRMAGTNEPLDYVFQVSGQVDASRVMKTPWTVDMPFTGIGVRPLSSIFNVELSCKTPFSRIRLFFRGGVPKVMTVKNGDHTLPYIQEDYTDGDSRPSFVEVNLEETTDAVTLGILGDKTTVLAGAELTRGTSGTLVHSIGNNGATYQTYMGIPGFADETSALNPALIIIALGTNEAFSRISDEEFLHSVADLVEALRESNPSAEFLIVPPTECYRRTRVRRGKGRRRASVLTVNTKCARLRSLLADYAATEGIPFYDVFDICGGTGAAAKMKKAKVLGADGVHFTAQGYRLTGNLLADALLRRLAQTENNQ